ncbi:gluconolaconase [Aureimonas endophytica]|uniref:Gluconolaconase n=1 Tax=Aureimonas endophytica TaxID=2027858 RepID=A0A916ZBS6_9HYPH|nr:SMP-30/gluconolactonase/LRE family protein [Aureimonas endophytica]GGD86203.1 gluconolaconase [Aureimonas endophytica]
MTAETAVAVLHAERCHLGEGPTYDRATDTAWWFDILGKTLFEHRFASGETRRHALPMMASQLSFVDADRQLLATDAGFYLRRVADGSLEHLAPLESDPGLRSNDGRTHPAGALWIGTMSRTAERGAGAVYWFRGGELRRLFSEISIPNAICFSPDGATGYFADTMDGRLMRVPLDPATGLPLGEPVALADARGEEAGLDGAVVDADGLIWVARWGGARVSAFDPSGALKREIAVPARQASCPAFVGPNLDRMIVTSAWEGMDETTRAADPQAGMTFLLDMPMRGRDDPPVLL